MHSLPLTAPRALALALVATLALASCKTVQTTQPGAVGVDRKQVMMLSPAEVDKASAQAYQQTMQQATKKGTLNRSAAQVARVRAIAQRLIPATASFRADAPRWAWEVNVISSNEVNAWCMPGGKIAVYTGLIDRLKVTDNELAAVMGHEIAHALREHGRERASQQMAQQTVVGIGAALLGIGDAGASLVNIVADVTVGLPYSREFEREADRIGVELAARAGYDPRAAVTLWQKMGRTGGSAPPQFLSTHPAPENRQRDLANYAAQVMPLYEAARRR
ncbi:MAG: M48 family metallopeptidase [Betaproteobacteria bacterium]|nr:M48 family metallopeptidase [Betaproteobacteria bacterium]